ncbi:hypothetical protein ACFSSA_09400 [Luteolibacter algae]|uniref:Uncharacterized protein n=1 Tax=Luteolibacter algae TaxID=454151 RepID=A0ABW5DA43_9BACT
MPLSQKKLVPGILLLLMLAALASPPLWWSDPSNPVSTVDPPNNKGPANIGQAKHMAKAALDALAQVLPTTAAAIESDLVGPGKPIPSWAPPANQTERDKNHAPLLIGQLKAIADPFYTHLHNAAPAWLDKQLADNGTKDNSTPENCFPWTSAPTDDSNRGVANIGQLKAVFSLRFEYFLDSDNDGLHDGWETFYFGNLTTADPYAIGQPDGLSNKEKSNLGLNPTTDYSDPTAAEPSRFTYDLAGRLTVVTAPAGAGNYTPDEEGNLLTAQ